MNSDKTVSFQIFSWAMGIVLVLFGWVFAKVSSLDTKVETAMSGQSDIKVQLSQIQTDLTWIKEKLLEK